MLKLINVYCNNCGEQVDVVLKRYNESLKKGWKFYCSLDCRISDKLTGKFVQCSNITCTKVFYRNNKNIKTNNYCSSSCAAMVNNLNLARNKFGFNGYINKQRIFTEKAASNKHKSLKQKKPHTPLKYCFRPFCYNTIPLRSKYCSVKCQRLHQSPKIPEYKDIVLAKIKEFVCEYERIPTKRELESVYKIACRVFGRWNRAIEAAGYTSNPVLFANKHIALDGHKCDSFAEMIIDNWLFKRGIEHSINSPYPGNNKYTVDFKVGDYWIEYFGLINGVEKYKKSFEKKLLLSKKYKIKLIKIYPSDLFPSCNLDLLLEPVIMYYSKSFVTV